ncbi:MAG: polysaccharide lyase [Bacteroidota bacterium]
MNKIRSLLLIGVVVLMSSCAEDVVEPASLESLDEQTAAKATKGTFNVWFSRPNGKYWYSNFVSDFGNVSGYSNGERDRHYISSNAVRITIPKNKYGEASGVWAKVRVQDASRYNLEYKVKFSSGFDWDKGGKLPGLVGGKGYTGCRGSQAKNNGDGWSARVMWHKWTSENGGKPYIVSYLYYKNMPNSCGHEPGGKKTINSNTWYTVRYEVKLNTGSNNNGKLKIVVGGQTIYNNNNFRYATKWSPVNNIHWDIFRGGGDSSWASSKTGYIYIDNVRVQKNP